MRGLEIKKDGFETGCFGDRCGHSDAERLEQNFQAKESVTVSWGQWECLTSIFTTPVRFQNMNRQMSKK